MSAARDKVVFDLDGTLCNVEHRMHHIAGPTKDWEAFYRACSGDTPILPVVHIAQALSATGYGIWLVSGRGSEARRETVAWLGAYSVPFEMLLMRPEGSRLIDAELKRGWIHSDAIPRDRVLCVFEDRASVVKMWREEGFQCYQVAAGDF